MIEWGDATLKLLSFSTSSTPMEMAMCSRTFKLTHQLDDRVGTLSALWHTRKKYKAVWKLFLQIVKLIIGNPFAKQFFSCGGSPYVQTTANWWRKWILWNMTKLPIGRQIVSRSLRGCFRSIICETSREAWTLEHTFLMIIEAFQLLYLSPQVKQTSCLLDWFLGLLLIFAKLNQMTTNTEMAMLSTDVLCIYNYSI